MYETGLFLVIMVSSSSFRLKPVCDLNADYFVRSGFKWNFFNPHGLNPVFLVFVRPHGLEEYFFGPASLKPDFSGP